ncbi:MAG: helix-turn-helix domain-containing protein [Clostridiales bacterium]|nr:helix-turn-helix domain-containing protein [Dethiobacter sp.]MBS4032529.1 helix-turn-helix domain-containing protein [Clostridiales bacterium]
MPHWVKVSGPDKVAAIEKYLRDEDSLSHIATQLGVRVPSIRKWLNKYQSLGPDSLLNQ